MNHSIKNEGIYDYDRIDRHVWAQQRATGLSRRTLLKNLLGVTVGAAAGFPARSDAQGGGNTVKFIDPAYFVTHGTNHEARFETFKGLGYLTPAERFFVRNHTSTPVIDPLTWKLRIEGNGVTNPRDFTLDELKAYPAVTLTRAIECAGNGRSFFLTQQGIQASGTQWRLGAIGVSQWTGVRLSTLLDDAGIKDTALDVQPEGLDAEVGATGHVRRALPIERALENDVLVVYGQNGHDLAPDHGFPARLLVPGWIGIANIKWLGRIEVSEQPLFSAWNTTQYRYFGTAYPDEPILSVQTIKSAFELPFNAVIPRGLNLITGRSWSAAGTIQRVEVSFNGGVNWQRATIKQGTNGHQAWAEWQIPWSARAGSAVLKARAFDDKGNSQPDSVPHNNQGYLFSPIVSHPVTVA